jgi:hypothetical protein
MMIIHYNIFGCKDGGKKLNGQYLVCGIFLPLGAGSAQCHQLKEKIEKSH